MVKNALFSLKISSVTSSGQPVSPPIFNQSVGNSSLKLQASGVYSFLLMAPDAPSTLTYTVTLTNNLGVGSQSTTSIKAFSQTFTLLPNQPSPQTIALAPGSYSISVASNPTPGVIPASNLFSASVSCNSVNAFVPNQVLAPNTQINVVLNTNAPPAVANLFDFYLNKAPIQGNAAANVAGSPPYYCAWDHSGFGVIDGPWVNCQNFIGQNAATTLNPIGDYVATAPSGNSLGNTLPGRKVTLEVTDSCFSTFYPLTQTIAFPQPPAGAAALPMGGYSFLDFTMIPSSPATLVGLPDERYWNTEIFATNPLNMAYVVDTALYLPNQLPSDLTTLTPKFTKQTLSLNQYVNIPYGSGGEKQVYTAALSIPNLLNYDFNSGQLTFASGSNLGTNMTLSYSSISDAILGTSIGFGGTTGGPQTTCTYSMSEPTYAPSPTVLSIPCTGPATDTSLVFATNLELGGTFSCNPVTINGHTMSVQGSFNGFPGNLTLDCPLPGPPGPTLTNK